MKVTLKDGACREYAKPKSILDIAQDLSEGLARAACAGEVDGERVDLRTVIDQDCSVNILTFEDKGGRDAFRHTAAHIMAQAVKRLYPNAKLAIGPSIDDGFYYDIDSEETLTSEDFSAIESEMKKREAIQFFEEKEEPYKVELIRDLPEDAVISLYRQGEFTDLCAGPHLMSTKPVEAVKLMKIAGAYWRGSEKNKMLTRIYGTAYTKNADLEAYVTMLEEAKKRDHRKLGKELHLFMFAEEGPGFPFFLPKGMTLKNALMQYWREIHEREGYVEISTLVMLNRHLWETSGHWDHYKENMYTTVIDGEDFAIKPMNCPGGMLVYQSQPHSYRELPLRLAEVGLMHRPIMIHRVCFGSIERFIGILTEHFAGKFPTWLAPVQVRVLPISDKYTEYGHQILNQLKEEENGLVSVRSRFEGDAGQKDLHAFIDAVKAEIEARERREENAE